MDRERLKIENEILEKIAGKVFLLQDAVSKREVIFQIFMEVYNSSECQKFVRKNSGLEMEGFFNEFLSYGIIEDLLANPQVEDIMINYLNPIYVHKAREGLVKTDIKFKDQDELNLLIKKLVIFSGRSKVKKINNVELANIKGRANIIYSPFGPQVTITRAKSKPLSIIDLIKSGTLNHQLAAQFWIYVEGLGLKPANILISGGPGAGKTTLLNALFSFISDKDRIVVIEDTMELNTEMDENCARLDSDEETSIADLVRNSLRMRPDRVIVGEVRSQEAQDLMTAMNIGKYCMGTLHASTARETIMRLENEPMNVPSVLVNLIDVFVIMSRFNINNKVQRVVGELVETGGMERKMVLLSSLWAYDVSKRDFVESAVSSIFRDKLAKISGKSPMEVMEEFKIRTNILKILDERNISDYSEVTRICRKYANNPGEAIAELGLKRENLIH